ncbi:MAG: helix-turn-helix domain-containing protein [Acidobacteriota bacterium]|nr:helix-turn-helix domain-containing protein [Acidobacteriota bacterium]
MPEPTQQPYSELASFGEELRREREIRGISLKEIADATKISKRFLEAIERNDHRTLPAPVFTRGFIREYSRYLGLNADEIVNRYNFAAAGDDRIEKSPHLERLTHPDAPPKKGIPPPYARVDRNVYVLLLIIAILAAATFVAMRHKRATAEASKIESPVTPPRRSIAPPPALAAPQPMRMTIDADAASIIQLDADGKEVINETLHSGAHRTVQAMETFHFRTIGNAAGIKLALNDVPLAPLGRDGEVIHDRTFGRGDLRTNP